MTAADTFFQKGTQAYLARDFAKSTKWFTMALLENPENVNHYYYREMSFQEMELYTEAVEDYTTALELYSRCVPIRYMRHQTVLCNLRT
jgi:tetratricopeptide (TPR) repeat protein